MDKPVQRGAGQDAKYCPAFPGTLGHCRTARAFAACLHLYNTSTASGIGMHTLTRSYRHRGRVSEKRQAVLNAA